MTVPGAARSGNGQRYGSVVAAPFGAIGIRTALGLVSELVYLPLGMEESAECVTDRIAERAARQVKRYLVDPDFRFDLPLAPVGSAFQRRVWSLIEEIPRGQVRSYGALARVLRSSPRAVGQACGANWYPLVIPCHRVVAANGLGGFAGTSAQTGAQEPFQIQVKRWLLRHEDIEAPRT